MQQTDSVFPDRVNRQAKPPYRKQLSEKAPKRKHFLNKKPEDAAFCAMKTKKINRKVWDIWTFEGEL